MNFSHHQRQELTILGLNIPLEAAEGDPFAFGKAAPFLIVAANPDRLFDFSVLSHALTVTTSSKHRTCQLCRFCFHEDGFVQSGRQLYKLLIDTLVGDNPPHWARDIANWRFEFRRNERDSYIPAREERRLSVIPDFKALLHSTEDGTVDFTITPAVRATLPRHPKTRRQSSLPPRRSDTNLFVSSRSSSESSTPTGTILTIEGVDITREQERLRTWRPLAELRSQGLVRADEEPEEAYDRWQRERLEIKEKVASSKGKYSSDPRYRKALEEWSLLVSNGQESVYSTSFQSPIANRGLEYFIWKTEFPHHKLLRTCDGDVPIELGQYGLNPTDANFILIDDELAVQYSIFRSTTKTQSVDLIRIAEAEALFAWGATRGVHALTPKYPHVWETFCFVSNELFGHPHPFDGTQAQQNRAYGATVEALGSPKGRFPPEEVGQWYSANKMGGAVPATFSPGGVWEKYSPSKRQPSSMPAKTGAGKEIDISTTEKNSYMYQAIHSRITVLNLPPRAAQLEDHDVYSLMCLCQKNRLATGFLFKNWPATFNAEGFPLPHRRQMGRPAVVWNPTLKAWRYVCIKGTYTLCGGGHLEYVFSKDPKNLIQMKTKSSGPWPWQRPETKSVPAYKNGSAEVFTEDEDMEVEFELVQWPKVVDVDRISEKLWQHLQGEVNDQLVSKAVFTALDKAGKWEDVVKAQKSLPEWNGIKIPIQTGPLQEDYESLYNVSMTQDPMRSYQHPGESFTPTEPVVTAKAEFTARNSQAEQAMKGKGKGRANAKAAAKEDEHENGDEGEDEDEDEDENEDEGKSEKEGEKTKEKEKKKKKKKKKDDKKSEDEDEGENAMEVEQKKPPKTMGDNFEEISSDESQTVAVVAAPAPMLSTITATNQALLNSTSLAFETAMRSAVSAARRAEHAKEEATNLWHAARSQRLLALHGLTGGVGVAVENGGSIPTIPSDEMLAKLSHASNLSNEDRLILHRVIGDPVGIDAGDIIASMPSTHPAVSDETTKKRREMIAPLATVFKMKPTKPKTNLSTLGSATPSPSTDTRKTRGRPVVQFRGNIQSSRPLASSPGDGLPTSSPTSTPQKRGRSTNTPQSSEKKPKTANGNIHL